jgi:hypothetical protein
VPQANPFHRHANPEGPHATSYVRAEPRSADSPDRGQAVEIRSGPAVTAMPRSPRATAATAVVIYVAVCAVGAWLHRLADQVDQVEYTAEGASGTASEAWEKARAIEDDLDDLRTELGR